MASGTYKLYGHNRRRRLFVGGICSLGLTATVVAIMFFGHEPAQKMANYHPPRPNSQTKIAAHPPPPKTVNYGLPVRLKIPKLAVDAPITYMGLTKTGNMAAPPNITDVGWYKNGTLPGNKGSAVLAGHIDGLQGQPGVFAGLDKLQKGDTLQVIDSNSTTISFTVQKTRTYSGDAQPSEVFNATDAAQLNLITCTGAWDNAQRHFLERLVVFTDKSS